MKGCHRCRGDGRSSLRCGGRSRHNFLRSFAKACQKQPQITPRDQHDQDRPIMAGGFAYPIVHISLLCDHGCWRRRHDSTSRRRAPGTKPRYRHALCRAPDQGNGGSDSFVAPQNLDSGRAAFWTANQDCRRRRAQLRFGGEHLGITAQRQQGVGNILKAVTIVVDSCRGFLRRSDGRPALMLQLAALNRLRGKPPALRRRGGKASESFPSAQFAEA